MTKAYDILIIGSGMGGLVSAVLLAQEGYRVCVLEKNNQYGGNLQTFARNKVIFDTGVHYLGALAKGQNLHQLFEYLGIIDEISLEQLDGDGYDIITFEEDPNEYRFAQGYPQFFKQLTRQFPNDKEAIQAYIQKMQDVCAAFPLYNLEEGGQYDAELLSLNLKDFLDRITTNEKLKAVLAGPNLLYAGDEHTPFYVHALSINSYIQSAWRCLKGGSQITKALVKQLRKLGGEIYKRKEVTAFIYEEQQLIGVKTNDNQSYYAEKFISNIDLNRTIELAGPAIYKKPMRQRIEQLTDSPSSFSVHIVFKPNSFPYFNHNIYHFKDAQEVWKASKTEMNQWPRNYMISMGASKANLSYAENMSVLCYMDYNVYQKWAHTVNTIVHKSEREEGYHQLKKMHTQLVLDALKLKFPDIEQHIMEVYATTPLTYRDYIGGRNGNMYGFKKNSQEVLNTYISHRTKIKNLFVTGQSVNMHGILGVTLGALNTCSDIIGRHHLLNKIKKHYEKI